MSSTKGTNLTKDVIYIDVDDEITGIIDKVQGSGKKIVALVLPKRATVLQSVVNMKLLKRAAGEAKKNLVLITSESGLIPLAGSVGIHVAKTISSKPEVPDAPDRAESKADADEAIEDAEDSPMDANKTVGELSGTAMAAHDPDDETIELDDEEESPEADKPTKSGKSFKNRKFKIPNFNKFRLLLVLVAVGVILLSSVGYAALAVWPKATITIKTDSSAVNSSVVLTLKVGADVALEADKGIVPAQLQEVKKTLTQEVPATGQQNNGEKATGSVKLSLTDCSKNSVSVPAGTGISSGGKTFITKQTASMDSVKVGNQCKNADFPNFSTDTVDVVAQTGGTAYNLAPASFTVAGYSNVTGASSVAMTGGTDSIKKIVTQADIDSAKQKITEQDTKPIVQELKSALIGRELFALDVTFGVGAPETKLSAEANTEAEVVTVTQTINYSMMGVKQEDLEKVVASDAEKKIDTKKQAISSYGLDDAFFSVQGLIPDGASVSMQTTAIAGAELKVDAIKKQVAGKKAGDAKEIISANPGVTDVAVSYSPFWVGSIPKKTDKITIIIEEPKVTSKNADSP